MLEFSDWIYNLRYMFITKHQIYMKGMILMTSLFSYMITAFGGLFWLLRVVVAITYTLGVDFSIVPLDFTTEIILLFVTIIAMIFIVKRNIIGALIYFVAYGWYFGNDLYNNVINIINGQPIRSDYLSIFISFIGVIIPFLTVMDIFLNKERKGSTKDKGTDWFYENEEYTRKLDERADNNQYRIK